MELAVTGLCLAAKEGDLAKVKKLLAENGFNPNTTFIDGFTPLMYAACPGHLEVVRALLAAGAHVDGRDKVDRTALMSTADLGHPEVAEELLQAGADINAKDSNGQTPLMYAAAAGQLTMVGLLVSKGAELNAVDRRGCTPLMYAVQKGRTAVVQKLLEVKADTGAKDAEGRNALSYAFERCKAPALQVLAATQSDEEMKETFNSLSKDVRYNALVASAKGEAVVLKRMLQLGVDPNTKGKPAGAKAAYAYDPLEQSVLMGACAMGYTEGAKALLAAGANPCIREGGKTPLLVAIDKGNNALAEALLSTPEARSVANTLDAEGDLTALMLAVSRHPIVVALLAAGADIHSRSRNDDTALMYAVRKGKHETVVALLDAGVDVNVRNKDGLTALQHAVRLGHGDDAAELIKHGADPNMTTKANRPLLYDAIEWGHTEVVTALLEGGANPNKRAKYCNRTEDGTALHLAIQIESQAPLIQALLTYGANPHATALYKVPCCCLRYDSHVNPLELARTLSFHQYTHMLELGMAGAVAQTRTQNQNQA